jgi:hypothetical protein
VFEDVKGVARNLEECLYASAFVAIKDVKAYSHTVYAFHLTALWGVRTSLLDVLLKRSTDMLRLDRKYVPCAHTMEALTGADTP